MGAIHVTIEQNVSKNNRNDGSVKKRNSEYTQRQRKFHRTEYLTNTRECTESGMAEKVTRQFFLAILLNYSCSTKYSNTARLYRQRRKIVFHSATNSLGGNA